MFSRMSVFVSREIDFVETKPKLEDTKLHKSDLNVSTHNCLFTRKHCTCTVHVQCEIDSKT